MVRRVLIAGLLTVCAPGVSAAGTINFASLSQPGSAWVEFGKSLTFDGFVFTSSYQHGGPGLVVWQASNASHPAGGDSATSLMEYTAGHETTITRSGGGAFDLFGIDLGNYGNGFAGSFNVTFTGTRSDTSVVSQTFTVASQSPVVTLQSFAFSGFTDLVNVKMTQGVYAAGNAFQFNNLKIDTGVTTPVPEPASLWLLASGVSVLAAARRRFHP